VTITFRKNGIDTALSVVITPGFVGELEDNLNSIACIAGDTVVYRVVGGSPNQVLRVPIAQMMVTGTTWTIGSGQCAMSDWFELGPPFNTVGLIANRANTLITNPLPYSNGIQVNADSQMKVHAAYTLKRVTICLNYMEGTEPFILTVQKAGVSTSLSISCTTAEPKPLKKSTLANVSLVDGDLLSLKLDMGAVDGLAYPEWSYVYIDGEPAEPGCVETPNDPQPFQDWPHPIFTSAVCCPPAVPPDVSIGEGAIAATLSVTYQPVFGGTFKPITLQLQVLEWREQINSGASIIALGRLNGRAFGLGRIKFTITCKGIIYWRHRTHAQENLDNPVSWPGHQVDFIDLEEAALLWNANVNGQPVTVTFLGLLSGDRVYSGVIQRLSLIRHGGTDMVDFILTFAVARNDSQPAIREWN
jgi:hypothetical protein